MSIETVADDGINYLRRNWFLLVALAAGAVTWGVTTQRLANAEEEAEDNKTKIEQLQSKINVINQTTVRIETNQMRNRDDLVAIDDKLDSVLDAIRSQPR